MTPVFVIAGRLVSGDSHVGKAEGTDLLLRIRA